MKDILDTAADVAERLRKTAEGTPDCEVPRNPAQARDGYEALTALIEEAEQLRARLTRALAEVTEIRVEAKKMHDRRDEALIKARAEVTTAQRLRQQALDANAGIRKQRNAADAALTACEAERDELDAQLATARVTLHDVHYYSRRWSDIKELGLYAIRNLDALPARAQTMKAVVDAAVKWFVNPTMSEGSLALEDAIIAHRQQDTPS